MYNNSINLFLYAVLQAASDAEVEKCERAFVLQLLQLFGSDGSNSGKEVAHSLFSLLICEIKLCCWFSSIENCLSLCSCEFPFKYA